MEAPKTHAAVISTPEKIREIIAGIKKKFPWYGDNQANLRKIFDWLWENDAVGGFDQHNVEVAVEILHPELEYDPAYVPPKPPPPPPAPPKPPTEVLEPGQLSIHAGERELKKATPAQILDYLRRVREAQRK